MNGSLQGTKDNANPTILSVDRALTQTRKRRQALEYPELAALSAPPEPTTGRAFDIGDSRDSSFFWGSSMQPSSYQQKQQRTTAFAQDRRIMLQALADAAEASKGDTVSLLRQHLIIPDNADALQHVLKHEPLFVPHPETAVLKGETTVAKSSSSSPPRQQPRPEQPDPVTPDEIFEIIRDIQDPEHPLTLEQLSVVSREQITIHENNKTISVRFTPTVPHCSMATLIGLTLSVKLWRSVQPRYKVVVSIEPGSHASESAINKQLADKERVCAALENQHLLGVVNKCIANGMNQHSL